MDKQGGAFKELSVAELSDALYRLGDRKVDSGGVVDNFSFQGFMSLDMVFWGT